MLVNETKFKMYYTQNVYYLLSRKIKEAFAVRKLLTLQKLLTIFQNNTGVFGYIVVKHLTRWPLNELIKLTLGPFCSTTSVAITRAVLSISPIIINLISYWLYIHEFWHVCFIYYSPWSLHPSSFRHIFLILTKFF